MNRLRLVLVCCAVATVPSVAFAAKGTAKGTAKYNRVSSVPILDEARFIKLAKGISDAQFAGLSPEEKKEVEERRKEQSNISGLALSSEAAARVAFRNSMGLFLAAEAAILAPKHALVLNTFGAALNREGLTSEALQVLVYARSLFPDQPLILTNLARSAVDIRDLIEAESLLRHATRVDKEFCGAWNALGSLYISQGKLTEATSAFLAAAPCHPVHWKRRVAMKRFTEEDPPPGPILPPGAAISPVTVGRAGRPLFRTFPQFYDWKHLVSSSDFIGKWASETLAISKASSNRLLSGTSKAGIEGIKQRYLAREERKKASPWVWIVDPSDDVKWALDVNEAYFSGEIRKSHLKAQGLIEAGDKKMTDAVERAAQRYQDVLQQAGGDITVIKQHRATYCSAVSPAVDEAFATWRNARKEEYEATVRVLAEWISATDAWIAQIPNDDERELAAAGRNLSLYVGFGALFADMGVRGLLYMSPFLTVGDCDAEERESRPGGGIGPAGRDRDTALELSVQGKCGEGRGHSRVRVPRQDRGHRAQRQELRRDGVGGEEEGRHGRATRRLRIGEVQRQGGRGHPHRRRIRRRRSPRSGGGLRQAFPQGRRNLQIGLQRHFPGSPAHGNPVHRRLGNLGRGGRSAHGPQGFRR